MPPYNPLEEETSSLSSESEPKSEAAQKDSPAGPPPSKTVPKPLKRKSTIRIALSPGAPERLRAIQRLRRALRRHLHRRNCDFHLLRAHMPGESPSRRANWGRISFVGASSKESPFIHASLCKESHSQECMERRADELIDIMERRWKLPHASVMISVTGGAQDFDLPHRLHQAFSHGLGRAAQVLHSQPTSN